ncbi:hypothetical protein [Streptomyces cirratus]|uniref:hypothetical protein n=1 Tax=Streptomyces cirratus TaxID=68187 RepID=UPI0036142F6B
MSTTPSATDNHATAAQRLALLRTARDVAEDLAADAIARDRAGRPPIDETARLREAGLPAALTPPRPGRGTDWRTGCAVIREIAAADGSLGEVLARHYAHAWDGRFYAADHRATALEEESVREQWLWTGAVHTPPPTTPVTDPTSRWGGAPRATCSTGAGAWTRRWTPPTRSWWTPRAP